MDEHSNDTGSLESEPPRTDHRIKLTLIAGAGSAPVDPSSDSGYERLMDAFTQHHGRRRRRRMIAFILSAASAVLGYFAMLHFLSR